MNLKYYLVDLSQISETFILNSNTLLDNIMYCDKVYKKDNLPEVLHTVMKRAEKLEPQEQQELDAWIRNILMTICKGQEKAVEEILENAKKGGNDMAFQYNIIKEYENEGRKGERRGKKILNTLFQHLKDDGRIDELLASVDDTKLQNKLLKEYGLSVGKK